ncbi:gliding motility-associated C-terminal domain-containing protein [Flavipsychrobacter stenotrophus]|uniref:gliding motility-associated C-terminal domain-containing protein n=1 Tax=Flavipsychrobacter stenotrophus TaxID=2077091 RepID=UPI001374E1EC|nr:gliding motility-associated C-terminal domain-containing protein [Flavipsychrobacter stenotrophus]
MYKYPHDGNEGQVLADMYLNDKCSYEQDRASFRSLSEIAKNIINIKKIILLLIIGSVFNVCQAQSLARTVVGSQGDYFSSPTVSVAWTVGEVMGETYAPPDYFLTQGFHQPDKKRRTPEVESGFFNGFSPNGDGINDSWSVPMLIDYPKNTVTIINRWGNEVWKRDNYDNKSVVFNGENMNGNMLPDGTYYYIIQYNNQEKRGWVFIKR